MPVNLPTRIAFVDDDANLLSSHRRNFGRLKPDWDAAYFTDPHVALEAITAQSDITAAVLDIHMPGMSGLELASALRGVRPDLILIMLTGYADLQSALTAVNEIGVYRFYPKPTNLQTIIDGIENELNRRYEQHEDSLPTAFLDLFQLGVVAVDDALTISHMNAQAAEVMRTSSLVRIGAKNNLVFTPVPDGLDHFLHPSANLAPRRQQSFSLEHDAEKLSLFVRRMPKTSDGTTTFMVILVDPLQQCPPAIDDLMDLFGLTRSEAKLTQKLAEGLSLDQAAELVGISHSSARTYLKTIFSKIGVNRQPQLMKAVLSTIPSLRS